MNTDALHQSEIEYLRKENAAQRAEIETLRATIRLLVNKGDTYEALLQELKAHIIELQDKLNANSENSSAPPSSDYRRKKQVRPSSGKKRGGQPGHTGHKKEWVPSAQVTDYIKLSLPEVCECGGQVVEEGSPRRHQQIELPEIVPIVREYEFAKGKCTHCGKRQHAVLPKGVDLRKMGPRLRSLASVLTIEYHLSRRQIQKYLSEVFKIKVSLGCLSETEGDTSSRLLPLYEELGKHVRNAKHLHIDETGYRQQTKRGWLWLSCTTEFSYYKLSPSRSRQTLVSLIGEHYAGEITSDRYGAYNLIPLDRRQLCWAHITRDIKRLSQSQDKSTRRIGWKLLHCQEDFFKHLKECAELKLPCNESHVGVLRKRFLAWLRIGAQKASKQFRGTCRNILNQEEALWGCTVTARDPTNNAAEREIRPAVIHRKITLGVQSVRGAQFFERAMSIYRTCRKSGVHFLEGLTSFIESSLCGAPLSLHALLHTR